MRALVSTAVATRAEPYEAFTLVVPTWNEAAWLPRLLECAKRAPEVDEIIVADNSSADATRRIAHARGCRVVGGGTPAEGRNVGARLAKHEYLLFTDADVIFSQAAVRFALETFRNADISAIHFRTEPLGGGRFVHLSYQVLAAYIRIFRRLGIDQGVGSLIAVRKTCFESIGGFREDLAAGEDADFFRRISSVGRVHFEESLRVIVSPRRLSLENPAVFALKTCLWAVLRLLDFPVSLISYKWRQYSQQLADRDEVAAQSLTMESGHWV